MKTITLRTQTFSTGFAGLTAAVRLRIIVTILASASAMGAGFDLDPQIIGSSNPYPPRGQVQSVAVRNGVAFCSVGSHLGIFDVRDPTKPLWLSAGSTAGRGTGSLVALFGSNACFINSEYLFTFDVADPATPLLLGTVGPLLGGQAHDVTISGHYAYVTLGEEGVQVIDLADPAQPKQLGRLDTEWAWGVAVAGDYAYVADEVSGLEVINVSNPAQLSRVAGYKTAGPARAVAVQDDHAFVAAGFAGLQVIDVRIPAAPQLLGGLNTIGEAMTVEVAGKYAYVGDSNSGVHIIDTSDPSNLILLGSYQTGGFEVPQIALDGNRAFLAAGRQGLQVIDVRDPTNPHRVGNIQPDGIPWSMAVRGNHAFVAEGNSGLQIIDISDPNRAGRVGEHKTDGTAKAVVLEGNLAYTLAQTFDPNSVSLEIFDVTNVSNPIQLGALETGEEWTGNFAVSGGYAYLIGNSGASGWLDIIDVRNPASPKAIASSALDSFGRSLTMGNAHVYIVSDQGIEIFDVQDPANPKRQERLDLFDAGSIALAENYLYVSGSSLRVLDTRDPNKPYVVSELAGTGGQIMVAGHLALLLAGLAINAVDISDPVAPRLVASVSTLARPFASAAVGESVLVMEALSIGEAGAFWTTGIELIDFGRWANPQRLGKYPPDETERQSVAVSGNLVCVTERTFRGQNPFTMLEILNVSDPTKPILIGTNEIVGSVLDVAIDGSRAYLTVATNYAPNNYELQIIDLTNPKLPTKLGSIKTTGVAFQIALSGNYAYVAGYALEIIDVSNPANPKRVGRYGGSTSSVAVSGNLAYVTTDRLLDIIDITIPSNPTLVSSVPGLAAYARVAIFGNHVCVAKEYLEETGGGGFAILDMTNPAKPREVSRVLTRSGLPAWDVAVTQNRAYVLISDPNSPELGRVEVYDLSDPANPLRVGGNTAASGYRLAISADKAFVVGTRGLTILNSFVPVRLAPLTSLQGTFRFSIGGPSNWPLRVQRSSDATNWNDWRTVTLGPTAVELDDPNATGQTLGFYRAVGP